jgi:MinD superfamily P-loop ATPase
MIVAIASGKGGTGKTSLSVNLARVYDGPVQLLDCDVEEPNVHLFLPGARTGKCVVTTSVPDIDPARCNACGECVDFCQFNALSAIGRVPMLWSELCHGCGGCMQVCPTRAIGEKSHRIGVIDTSQIGNITLRSGCLDIGVAMASALVHAVKAQIDVGMPAILDAPPGTACQTVATLLDADFVVLVTEPTPLGLNDLRLAVETARELRLPFGVVINRAGIGDDRVQCYCAAESIPVLLEIPEDRRFAETYSRGQLVVDVFPEYRTLFRRLWQSIEQFVTVGGAA